MLMVVAGGEKMILDENDEQKMKDKVKKGELKEKNKKGYVIMHTWRW